MWRFSRVLPLRIGRQKKRGTGKLRNRDVVGMTVSALRSKCRDNVWADAANVHGNLCLHLARVRAIQVAVDVVEKIDASDAQFAGGRAKLRFTRLTHHAQLGPYRGISET